MTYFYNNKVWIPIENVNESNEYNNNNNNNKNNNKIKKKKKSHQSDFSSIPKKYCGTSLLQLYIYIYFSPQHEG